MASAIRWRARDPAAATTDTDLFDLDPLTEAFNRFASHATASFLDTDGTKLDDWDAGQRIEFQYSTDDGSSWTTRFAGIVQDRTRTTTDGVAQVDLEVVKYDHLLRRRTVGDGGKAYNDTISNILNDLITNFTSVNWVAGNVTVTNDKTINRTFQGEKVDSVIAFLASESGNEEFGVNNDLEFFFRKQDVNRAPALGETDVIDYDLPEKGKRAVNRYTLFYGSSGGNAVVKEDRENQKDLKDKLNAPQNVVIADTDTMTEITSETIARAIAKHRLGERSRLQTGTVTTHSRFGTTAGDVLELTIGDAGISQTDFRVAQISYHWRKGRTEVTVAENAVASIGDLLVGLSDDVTNVRMRDADINATKVWDLDVRSGVTTTITATLTTKQPTSQAFIVGQSQVGQGTSDKVGGGTASTASITVNSKKATVALLNLMRDLWQGAAATDLTHLGVGTDSSAATRADDALQSAVDRVAIEKFGEGDSATQFEFTATIPAGGVFADNSPLAELGIFDADTSGNLYSRLTTDNITIDATTRLKIHIEMDVDTDGDESGVITTKGQERLVDLVVGGDTYALDFDGTGDFIGVSHTSALNITGDITIAAWIRPNTDSKESTVIGKRESSAAGPYAFRINQNDSDLDFYWSTSGGFEVHSAAGVVDDGVWQFVTAVRDGGTWRIYHNGSEAESGSIGSSPTTSTVDLGIGSYEGGSANEEFNGIMDEVRLYNQALTASEVSDLYNGVHVGAGLVGYWTFDEGSGATATDSVGSNDGTISGATYVATQEPADMTYGTGTTAAVEGDTALGSKQHEDTIDSTADRAPGVTDIVETIESGDANTTNFSEIGIENAANELLARLVFQAIPEDRTVRANYQFKAANA